jgi:hypothetical protein
MFLLGMSLRIDSRTPATIGMAHLKHFLVGSLIAFTSFFPKLQSAPTTPHPTCHPDQRHHECDQADSLPPSLEEFTHDSSQLFWRGFSTFLRGRLAGRVSDFNRVPGTHGQGLHLTQLEKLHMDAAQLVASWQKGRARTDDQGQLRFQTRAVSGLTEKLRQA